MEEYINKLDQNTNRLLENVRHYPLEKLTKKKGDQWSILEVLEHIYLNDKVVYNIVSRPSDKKSKTKEVIGYQKIETILIHNRDKKVKAHHLVYPKGNFKSFSDFKSAFTTLRNSIKDDLTNQNIILDNRIHIHLLLGEMTITDWLNFILFHTERHLLQIEERK